jgi:hypothetical protein
VIVELPAAARSPGTVSRRQALSPQTRAFLDRGVRTCAFGSGTGALFDLLRGLAFPPADLRRLRDSHRRARGVDVAPGAFRFDAPALPENLGSITPSTWHTYKARQPRDLVRAARANLVVRDGFAAFYFHPFLDLAYLKRTVEGIEAAGYRFVDPASL